MATTQDKPITLSNTLNNISLSWENTFNTFKDTVTYSLQIQNEVGRWICVYWGSKTHCQVKNLAPCTCYNFRIKWFGRELESDWLHFRSATETLQYFVMHVTRAIKFSKTSVIRKIITNRPILLETVNKEDKTPLIQAIEQDDLQLVTFLLNIGANVNNPTLITKRTPLMVALFLPNMGICKLLLSKGASVSSVDCNLLTGLHYAVDSNIADYVELCLQHKFNINAVDNKGWTPLLRAVVLDCSDDILSILIRNGADISLKDKGGFDFEAHLKMNNRDFYRESKEIVDDTVTKLSLERSK